MRAATFPSQILRRLGQGWTCRSCSQVSGREPRPSITKPRLTRGYTTSGGANIRSNANANANAKWDQNANSNSGSRSRRRIVLWATTGGAASAVGVLAFTDDIRASYEGVGRSGRVAGALLVCINDYRVTLNRREKEDDDEERSRLLRDCHKRCAVRTLRVLEQNGGIFIKLGQHLSAMNYLLPPEWTTTFVPLQDQCPVSSFDSIQQMFKQDTGEELRDYFSEFSAEPIGAASLAQVHLATIKATGQKVAVKVQHPGLAQWAPLDMSLTKLTFKALKRFFPEYDLEWLSSEMEISLPQELDFRREAENALRTKEHFARIPELPLVIPDVLWAKERILVMANESGRRLDDLDYLDSNGISRDQVSATLAHIFNEMIFGKDAPLHCDPHGGNIAIRKNESRRNRGSKANFDIILYDHGLYRDIPEEMRRSYAKMWLAIIDGDVPAMQKYVKEVAGVDEDKFPLFCAAITGREFAAVSSSSILKPRSASERDNMSSSLQDGLLADLVQLLGQVPRVMLLILKTNDLTRSLDENLHTRQGPLRLFMILAHYCVQTVLREKLEEIQGLPGSLYWPPNALRLLTVWWGFYRVEVKLRAFEAWLSVKRILRLQNVHFAGF